MARVKRETGVAASKGKGDLPPSPRKKTKTLPTSPSKLKSLDLIVWKINCIGDVEVIEFRKNDANDAFLGSLRQYLNGQLDRNEEMDALNLHSFVDRRIPFSANETMPQAEKPMYNRCFCLRFPPEQTSTARTRQQLLQTLMKFFTNADGMNYHRYPLQNINAMDLTTERGDAPLDQWFKDDTIQFLIQGEIDEAMLNSDFALVYPDLARQMIRGPNYGEYARRLGYARLAAAGNDDDETGEEE